MIESSNVKDYDLTKLHLPWKLLFEKEYQEIEQ